MDFPSKYSSSKVTTPVDKRVCHICRTKTTSQWRYRHPDNAILCNACGIRWKRKNKEANKEKIKPGRKRIQPLETGSASKSISNEAGKSKPSSSAAPSRPKPLVSIEELLSPADPDNQPISPQYKAHNEYRGLHKEYRAQYKEYRAQHKGRDRHSNGRSHHQSKMDISQLMSPIDEDMMYRPKSKKH